MIYTLKLRDLVSEYKPESWGRNEDWSQHAARLWREEGRYMARLKRHMEKTGSWPRGAVIVDGKVVQDGHHRIVVAWKLGWLDYEIPVEHVGAALSV